MVKLYFKYKLAGTISHYVPGEQIYKMLCQWCHCWSWEHYKQIISITNSTLVITSYLVVAKPVQYTIILLKGYWFIGIKS